jgi:phosphoglycolate phosphatase
MKTAVFDLDGTLADTAPDLIGALNEIAALEGWPALDPVRDRITAGQGGRALLRLGMARAGLPDDPARIEALVAPFMEAYAARVARETRFFPGTEAALTAMAAEGWRLAICTNKPEGLALALLDALGATAYFAAILGADTLPVRKPDPRHFHESVRRAGGIRGQAVMIGDTITDRETARRAEAPCILVRFGYADRSLADLAPDAVIDDFGAVAETARGLLSQGNRI